jgi:pilus assembly protein CpaD
MTKEAAMKTSLHVLRGCAALAALLLAGCASPVNGPEDNLPVTQRFPITVEPHMEALRLAYDGQRGTLDAESDAELARFARDYLENGSGAIAISPSRRFPASAGYITDRLVQIGVPRNRIMIGSDAGANAADDVRVSYIGYQAHAQACGDWSVNLDSTASNKVSPNLGCATQHNLAAMVADPRDLVSPKAMGADDTKRRLTVLEKYRKGEVTAAKKEQDQSGAVSDVANNGGK